MSEPLSAERLAEIRARCQKATDGPWTLSDDIEFTVTAMRDIPDLLAEVDRLEYEVLKVEVERVAAVRRASRWFSVAQDAHQKPGNAPRSHEHAEPGQPATTRQSDGTDPAWDGTGE